MSRLMRTDFPILFEKTAIYIKRVVAFSPRAAYAKFLRNSPHYCVRSLVCTGARMSTYTQTFRRSGSGASLPYKYKHR